VDNSVNSVTYVLMHATEEVFMIVHEENDDDGRLRVHWHGYGDRTRCKRCVPIRLAQMFPRLLDEAFQLARGGIHGTPGQSGRTPAGVEALSKCRGDA
jgi:hypothetical protein